MNDSTTSLAHLAIHPDRSEDILLELVRAVTAGRQGLRLYPDNRAAGWAPIAELVRDRSAFAVDVDVDVVALDADSPGAGLILEDFAELVRQHDAEPVVVASGRPGHRHMFARIPDPFRRAELVRAAKELGLDVRRTIRPPLGPHRLGLEVHLVTPTTPAEAVRALSSPRPVRLEDVRRLGHRAARALIEGHAERADRSRSGTVRSVALGAANAGWSAEHLYRALMIPTHRGGARVQELADRAGSDAARRYVRGELDRARQYVRAHPLIHDRGAALERIADIRAAADSRPECWHGMGGSTDRAVLEALLELGTISGNVTDLGASVRTLAERAGIGLGTASRALRRLEAAGWVRARRRGGAHGPGLYELSRPPDGGGTVLSALRGVCRDCSTSVRGALYAHDAFRWRALGKTAAAYLDALCAHPRTVAELGEAFAVTERTVRRHLAHLEAAGLAVRTGGGWVRADDALDRLDGLAVELGTAGALELARARHALNRAGYAGRRARLRPWAGPPPDPLGARCRTAARWAPPAEVIR